jgi:ABC-2 type transport system permease protein
VRAYWEIAASGFRRYATYRGATLAGLFTNSIFGVMRCYVLLALLTARPQVGGYDAQDAITYTWLVQGLLMAAYLWGWNELAVRVMTGDIVVDLGRPVDLQAAWLAADLGRAAYHLLLRGIPAVLVGALLFGLRLPDQPLVWPAFAASVALAVTISFSLRFLVNLCAFWLLDYRGIVNVTGLAWTFLCGSVVPLSFLPDGPRAVVEALPFAGVMQVPIDVFLGKHDGPAGLLGALAFQAAWALALLGLGRVVLASGVRRLVVQGG